MKLRLVPILLIAGIIFVAIFGFLSISSIHQGSYHTCPIAFMSDGDCPPVGSALALIAYHWSGLQRLTQSIISINISLLMLSVFLISVRVDSLKLLQKVLSTQHSFYQRCCTSKRSSFAPKKHLLRWLALRNKKDPHALHWAHDIGPARNFLPLGAA